jgi:hypothetical protein
MATIPVTINSCNVPTAQPETEPTDPAGIIATAGKKIAAAYRRYDELRVLTAQLNGLQNEDPIPEAVQIREVTIDFTVNGQAKTASLRSIHKVGDLADLLGRETEALIKLILEQATAAQANATAVVEACLRSSAAIKPPQIV